MKIHYTFWLLKLTFVLYLIPSKGIFYSIDQKKFRACIHYKIFASIKILKLE